MPSIPLHTSTPISPTAATSSNPLPALLHTPSGLALLELQGTIHFPTPTSTSDPSTLVGNLKFPLYDPKSSDPSDTKWMKRVYLYVGKTQRMSGEVKKLAKPFAVIRRINKKSSDGDVDMDGLDGGGERNGVEAGGQEELEIVEIVRFKIVFSTRPEPVSKGAEEEG